MIGAYLAKVDSGVNNVALSTRWPSPTLAVLDAPGAQQHPDGPWPEPGDGIEGFAGIPADGPSYI
jgi:hypothetical protein